MSELHPQAAAFLELVSSAPPLDELSVEENRAGLAAVLPLTGEVAELAEVRDLDVAGPDGAVRVRLYRPVAAPAVVGACLYAHGGGWVLGDLESHDTTCRDLAVASGGAVVAVDYRRAPEAAFPAALEDVLAVLDALLAGGLAEGLDPTRIAVAGDSAGGNLVAVAAQERREAGLVHQALIYPVCDAHVGATASYRTYAEGHFLTRRDMAYFVAQYAGRDADLDDPRLSPGLARDLTGVAPATVLTAACDPLRDEGEAYAARLERAGVPVEARRYAGQVHPFVLLGGLADDARDARAYLGGRLAAAYA